MKYDKTPYKYWFEFLKRSSKYEECCRAGGRGELADLYSDFGDVHACSFAKWFREKHVALFSRIPWLSIQEISTVSEFESKFDEGENDILGLIVHLFVPTSVIMTDIEKWVRQKKNSLRIIDDPEGAKKPPVGRPEHDDWQYVKYGLTPVPSNRDLKAFAIMLKVYDACKREDKKSHGRKKGLSRYEIGDKLKIKIKSRIPEDSPLYVPPTEESRRNLMTATVCRYNRQAKKIIENVERKRFPYVLKRYEQKKDK